MKSKATGCGSISTVFSGIVLLCFSSMIIIIIIMMMMMMMMMIALYSNGVIIIRVGLTKSQIIGLFTPLYPNI